MIEEENLENLNTSEEDSSEEEHPTKETETQETLEKGTPEEEHPSSEEEDGKVNWQKRHDDLQRKFTPMAQELAQIKGRLSETERQFPQPSPKELEEQEVAEFNQMMEQHKDNSAEGIVSWMRKREEAVSSRQRASLSPLYNQLQLLGWRQKQLVEGMNWDDLMKKEKKMQEVMQKNPAIMQFPNALEQAEALAIGAKDINQVKKEILKAEEQRLKQRGGFTVGVSKSKGKGKKTVTQRASEFYGMKFAEPK